mmetsp:Transcript_64637/g.114953  ORF Transcript_64637/g.114953 Transcript_64637/m.114953 type:complete len:203 (-) Transcript_64637:119-727(-)
MAIKLYGSKNNRGSRVLWMLQELGVPFELIDVPVAPGRGIYFEDPSKKADFLKNVHTAGRLPVLIDGDLTIAQSMAITLYLAKKYGGPLSPADLAEEAKCAEWTFWCMTEVEKSALEALFAKMQKKEATEALEKMTKEVHTLEAALTGKDYLVGGRFTVADLNVASIIQWAASGGLDLKQFPNVATWLAACSARKKVSLSKL